MKTINVQNSEILEVLGEIRGTASIVKDANPEIVTGPPVNFSTTSDPKDVKTTGSMRIIPVNINELKEIPEFRNFYSPQPLDELIESFSLYGQMTPIQITPDLQILNGYRMVDAIKAAGGDTVYAIIVDGEPDIHLRILYNQYRVKTIEDKINEIREVFRKYPKRQGQRSPEGEKYNRDELITKSLGNRWKGDMVVRKLEYVFDNDVKGDVLAKGIVEKGWKVDTCHEFLTDKMKVDQEKGYGFTQNLIDGTYTVSEVNKLIDQRSSLDKKYDHTFVIPEKVTLYHADCVELPRLLENKQEVDLIVTSIPYWDLRDYTVGEFRQLGHEKTKEEYALHVSEIFNKIFPILKDTSNVVINIGETYKDGVGQGIPFLIRDAIIKNTPLKYKETLIWSKKNPHPQGEKVKRPVNSVEYLLWFVVDPTKSKYIPLTFPVNGKGVKVTHGAKDVTSDGKQSKKTKSISKPYGKIMSHLEEQKVEEIISTSVGKNYDIFKISEEGHPAAMSPMLPVTLTLMLSDENDLVCDPFAGSSVVGKCAVELNRRFVGTELVKKYFEIGCAMMKLGVENFNAEEFNAVKNVVYYKLSKNDYGAAA